MAEQTKHPIIAFESCKYPQKMRQFLLIWMLIATCLLFIIHLLGKMFAVPPSNLGLPSLLTIVLCVSGALVIPVIHRTLNNMANQALIADATPAAHFLYRLVEGASEVHDHNCSGEYSSKISRYGIGTLYMEQGKWKQAVEHLSSSLKEKNRYTSLEVILFSLALAHAEEKEYEKAMNSLHSYLEHGGDPFLAHVLMGQIYDEEHDPSQAVSHYRMAIRFANKAEEETEIMQTVQKRLQALSENN